MPATPAWLAAVEAFINRSIAGSMQASALARQLDGTALQVDIEGITCVRAAVCGTRVVLLAGSDSQVDATISGSPMTLLRSQLEPVRAGGTSAKIRGDADIARLYRELFALARPDLEEELSRFIGDMPARRAAQLLERSLSWARRARRTFGENLAEYLQEEGRDLVNKSELEEFLRGVDELRETADRVEARLARLEPLLRDPA